MLRSLTDWVRVYFDPERLVLMRSVGLFKRRIGDKLIVPVETPSWQAAVKALATELTGMRWRHASVDIVLSGELAHFRLASWDRRLNEEERIALLRHQFTEIYGSQASSWQITLGDNGYGRPGLACAVDGQLLEAVQAVCDKAHIRLASVRPYLMTAFNQWRNAIGRDGWIVIVEPAGVTLALIQRGMWGSVRYQRLRPGWELELEVMLAREASQQGLVPETLPVYFFWAMRPGYKPELPMQYKVFVLERPGARTISQADKPLALLCN